MARAGKLKPGRNPREERTRLPEDAPPFAIGYHIRLQALIILHEGAFSATDIARMIGEDVRIVSNHLHELWHAGCIEFVGRVEDQGNLSKALYRAVKRPYVSDEALQAMSPDDRQDSIGVNLQWIMAECLASFRNKKMVDDEALCLMSDEPNLDHQGRIEMRDFLNSCWSGEPVDALDALFGVRKIAARAANRMAKSGETGRTMVVVLMAFERGRSAVSDGKPFQVSEM